MDDPDEIHLGEVDPEVLRVEAGEIEQVADQAFEALRLAQHHAADMRGLVRRHDVVGQRLGVAGDRGERGAQVVGHRQQELALSTLGVAQGVGEEVDGFADLDDLRRALRRQGDVAVAGGQRVRGGGRAAQRAGHPVRDEQTDHRRQPARDEQRPDEPPDGAVVLGHRVDAALYRDEATPNGRPALDEHGGAVDVAGAVDVLTGEDVGDVLWGHGVGDQLGAGDHGAVPGDVADAHAEALQALAHPRCVRGLLAVDRGLRDVGEAGQGLARLVGAGVADQPDRQRAGDDRGDHRDADRQQRDASGEAGAATGHLSPPGSPPRNPRRARSGSGWRRRAWPAAARCARRRCGYRPPTSSPTPR